MNKNSIAVPTRKRLGLAIGGLFAAPGAAFAACPSVITTISSALTETQCYDNESVTVTPTGSVTVTDTSLDNSAIRISMNPYTGTFMNNGAISASVIGTGYAELYGVHVAADLAGSFINAGSISSNSISGPTGGSSSAYAYGLAFGTVQSGATVTNTGTISARAVATDLYGYGAAYGMWIQGNLDGTVSNSGTISAVAILNGAGYTSGSGYGVDIGSIGATGSFTNTGTISASMTSSSANNSYGASSYVIGAYIGNNIDGSFANSGTISSTAVASQTGTAGSYAEADGVSVYQLNGTFTNSGSITATSTATGPSGFGNSNAYAYGVNNWYLNGTFNNSGTITATATGTDSANAYGVNTYSGFTGTLTNSGTIRAAAQGVSGEAYGIRISSSMDGTITNSGTVSATGSGGIDQNNVYSIYTSGGSGTVNNLAGGLLEGRIYLNGAVNLDNAGSIDIRQQASSVGGNFTQAATGVLRIGALDNATYGSLNVGGTANLAAGTTISLKGAAGHTLAAGTLSNVITSGGLTMSSVAVTDNVLALNYTAMANGNNVDLVATSTGLTSVAGVVPTSMGSIGGTLDSLLANIDSLPKELQTFLYSLGSQTTAQGVTDTVKKIQPMIVTSTTQSGMGAAQGASNVVLARLDNAQGRSAGDKFYGDGKFWVKPFGSWADQDDRGGVTGYKARTAGMVGGVDGDVKDFRLGLAFGYARSDVDGNSAAAPQSARVGSYQFMAYGSRALSQDTDVNFLAGFGLHDNSTRRTIDLGTGTSALATANYGSTSANVGAGIARAMKLSEKGTFTPSLRADYTYYKSNAYIESGAGALGLSVNSNDTAMFVVAADAKYVHQISERAKFSANLGLGYDLINERTTITSAFAGAPTAAFATQGMKLDPWIVRGGMGYTHRTGEGVELTGRYDLDVRSGFTNQTVSVNARWSF